MEVVRKYRGHNYVRDTIFTREFAEDILLVCPTMSYHYFNGRRKNVHKASTRIKTSVEFIVKVADLSGVKGSVVFMTLSFREA
jgi:hypothetical protein